MPWRSTWSAHPGAGHLGTILNPMTSGERAVLQGALGYLRRTPSAGLLLVQLLGILLYPWMEKSPRGRALLGAFGLLILGIALRVVRRSPWLTWLAFVLAFLVVALSIFYAIEPHPALPVAIAAVQSFF